MTVPKILERVFSAISKSYKRRLIIAQQKKALDDIIESVMAEPGSVIHDYAMDPHPVSSNPRAVLKSRFFFRMKELSYNARHVEKWNTFKLTIFRTTFYNSSLTIVSVYHDGTRIFTKSEDGPVGDQKQYCPDFYRIYVDAS